LADDEIDLAEIFPAAWREVFAKGFFETFFNGFFFATGFPARFDARPDVADADFFFAGFFAAAFAFDGLAERNFGARDLSVGRFRAGFAFRLALARDFFMGFEAFLAMVVLLLGRDSLASAPLVWILPRLGRFGKTSNYNMRLTGSAWGAATELVAGQLQLTSTFGLFHREIHRWSAARFGVIAAFSCVQPIPVDSFDKLGFQ